MLLRYAKDYTPLTRRRIGARRFLRAKNELMFSSSIKAIARFFGLEAVKVTSLKDMPSWTQDADRKADPNDPLPKPSTLVTGSNKYATDEIFVTKAYRITRRDSHDDSIYDTDMVFALVELVTPDGEYVDSDCISFSRDDRCLQLSKQSVFGDDGKMVLDSQPHKGFDGIYAILSGSFSYPFRKDFSQIDEHGYEYAMLVSSPRYIRYAQMVSGKEKAARIPMERFALEQNIAYKVTSLGQLYSKLLEQKISEPGLSASMRKFSHNLCAIGNHDIVEFIRMFSLGRMEASEFDGFKIDWQGISTGTPIPVLAKVDERLGDLLRMLQNDKAFAMFAQIENPEDHRKFVEQGMELGIDFVLDAIDRGVPLEDALA